MCNAMLPFYQLKTRIFPSELAQGKNNQWTPYGLESTIEKTRVVLNENGPMQVRHRTVLHQKVIPNHHTLENRLNMLGVILKKIEVILANRS